MTLFWCSIDAYSLVLRLSTSPHTSTAQAAVCMMAYLPNSSTPSFMHYMTGIYFHTILGLLQNRRNSSRITSTTAKITTATRNTPTCGAMVVIWLWPAPFLLVLVFPQTFVVTTPSALYQRYLRTVRRK